MSNVAMQISEYSLRTEPFLQTISQNLIFLYSRRRLFFIWFRQKQTFVLSEIAKIYIFCHTLHILFGILDPIVTKWGDGGYWPQLTERDCYARFSTVIFLYVNTLLIQYVEKCRQRVSLNGTRPSTFSSIELIWVIPLRIKYFPSPVTQKKSIYPFF